MERNSVQASDHVVLAAGGTGGHLFPAQSLAKKLQEGQIEISFVGVNLDHCPYFKGNFPSLSLKGASLKNPLKFLMKNSQGVWQAYRWLKEKRPRLVIGFGSYHSFPALAAALILKIPYFLVAADSSLGRVNRLFRFKAVHIFSPFEHKGVHKIELPTSLRRVPKEEALAHYGLSREKITLLIFGGSQGALHLNELLLEALRESPFNRDEIQIIHLTGRNKKGDELRALYHSLGLSFVVKEFEETMDMAYSAADIAISRAGAMTVCELMMFTIPSLFIPYPGAAAHQAKNAEIAISKGGGLMREEATLTPKELVQAIGELIAKRKELCRALTESKEGRGSASLASLVLKWLSGR